MSEQAESLRDLFHRAGLGDSFDANVDLWGTDGSKYVTGLVGRLDAVAQMYSQRFMSGSIEIPSPGHNAAVAMMESNPHKLRAFLQALLEVSDPEMLVMVWRVLHGDDILAIEMTYRLSGQFELAVELRADGGDERSQRYTSRDFSSTNLLHHFGHVELNGEPRFAGFFAHEG